MQRLRKKQRQRYLIIEAYVHHQHLPTDANPPRAGGVVRVDAASEPNLDTESKVRVGGFTAELRPTCVFFFLSQKHLVVFRNHPDHAHSDGHVKSFRLFSRRLHLDPRRACNVTSVRLGLFPFQQWELNENVSGSPLGLSRLSPLRTSRFPSHSTAHSRSPGPADNWATSLGASTSSQVEPSGTRGWMPSLNHTYTRTRHV